MEKDAKEKLIAAGERLFAAKGLAGVSIRQLAKEAGTNSALISYHFGSKEGLYAAILENQFAPIHELLDRVKGIRASATEKIMGYAHNVVIVHQKMPFLTKFLMGELLNPSRFFKPVIHKHIERIYLFITETLREGIAAGEFRSDLDVKTATLALAGIMNFYFITRPINRHFVENDSDQDAQYAVNAIEIFLNGVKNHDGQ
ncbi:TetR/AcrR family transcriptional regulator [Sporomusa termitida]|uniref:Bacterial regulatory protein, tetR family n=1 Tax=Sporomusa termitida TaxID=2377 RepID=A0A517DUW5_9FIRM|nr:TetR/AcrR family transcriptional regulator [Sporomusa termitida]QDR81152.1 Bacterial regulatory protein, tetR family [Sporomusa termitida]